MFFKKKTNDTIKKILLIRFSSIGDIVLTTPIIRCLKKQLPNIEIHFLTKPSFKTIISANPYIDKIHLLATNLNETISTLKNEQFDLIIDLHHNLRTLQIKKSLGIQSFSFPKLNIQKWLLVRFKWRNIMPDQSIVERYFKTVSKLGIKNDGEGLNYFIPDKDHIEQDDLPMSHWAGYVACVLGGSKITKQFPVHKWIATIQECPYPVILLGGPDDVTAATVIANAFEPFKVYNACGKFNINESAHIIQKSRVVISNDTGLMHIAAAFQKPVISLWGNTIPALGMFPYYGANNLKTIVSNKLAIVENNSIACRPCSKIGYNKCPKKHFKCMEELDPSVIQKHVNQFWDLK